MPERYLGQSLGRFRIDSLVGSGGFAWVYRGYDPELEIPVALKVLKPQFAGDELFETRFRREASTAAKLRHPNIIKILAVGREGEAVYFAMDYLAQGLLDRLTVMGTLPESILIRVGFDVASALGFAHREGVIHRDVKVDNIMFDDHGNAIVTDFGIARAVSTYNEQTGTNMVVGTPQYFSPEQARGLQLDGRADLYSLGVTLFKAGTGVLPFQGEDWYEIARQHVEDKPPRPRDLNPSLSKGMEEIILACLEKDPEMRFPNGESMCGELSQLLPQSEITSARTMMIPAADTVGSNSSLTPFRRRRRRFGKRGALLSAAGALIALVIAITLIQARPDAAARTTGSDGIGGDSPSAIAGRVAPVAASTPPALEVAAPDSASILVNGTAVGRGTWRSDTMALGTYEVIALVDAVDGCSSARDADTVTMSDTGITSVKLSPRECGYLDLSVTPEKAEYRLVSRATGRVRTGALPLSRQLILPTGGYQLLVTAPMCAKYDATVQIEPKRRRSQRIPLICRDSTPQPEG